MSEIKYQKLRNISAALSLTIASLLIPAACATGERPRIAEEQTPSTTTSTVADRKTQEPYYDKYGWNAPFDHLVPANTVINAIKNGRELLIAAGRCTVTLYDRGSSNAWEIIQNPAIVKGSENGHDFTGYVGVIFMRSPDVSEGIYRSAHAVGVVDNTDIHWGQFGLVPGELTMVDTPVLIQSSRGREYADTGTIDFYKRLYPETTLYETESSTTDFKPARIIEVPQSEGYRVKDYCNVPGLELESPQ